MITQEDYVKKSILERIYLRKIFAMLPTNFDWQYYLTDEFGYSVYDMELLKFKKGTGEPIGRYFVECKVRDQHWNELMLERKKFDDLNIEASKRDKKTKKESYLDLKSKLIYLCVTPEGSYWYDLNDIEKFNWDTRNCPVSTTDMSRGRTDKMVGMLDTKLARRFELRTGDIQNNDHKVIEKVLVTHRQRAGFTL